MLVLKLMEDWHLGQKDEGKGNPKILTAISSVGGCNKESMLGTIRSLYSNVTSEQNFIF